MKKAGTANNYKRGRAKEYRIMKKAREEGMVAIRTAGSHGFFDVIAIDLARKRINLIQAKPKSISEKKKDEIYEENKKYKGMWEVDFWVE